MDTLAVYAEMELLESLYENRPDPEDPWQARRWVSREVFTDDDLLRLALAAQEGLHNLGRLVDHRKMPAPAYWDRAEITGGTLIERHYRETEKLADLVRQADAVLHPHGLASWQVS